MKVHLALAGFLVSIVAVPCLAQQPIPVGSEFQVNTFTTGVPFFPSVAASGTGSFVVVWSVFGVEGSGGGIFGRRYDASGSPLGAQFQVNTYTTGFQQRPSVAMNASGDFVVAWESPEQDGSNYGVFAQRYDAAGSPLGPEFPVAEATFERQYRASVAMAGDGSFVVVWDGATQSGAYRGVYGRRFDASGNPQGPDFPLRSSSAGYGRFPAVAMNGAGEFIVAWNECCDGSGYGVLARRFDASAAAQGPAFAANSLTPQSQQDPAVGIDADGGFVIAWNNGDDVWARRFDPLGFATGVEFRVDAYTTGAQGGAAVSMSGDGAFVVAWQGPGDGSSSGIFGRSFDASGTPFGPDFRVNSYTTGDQDKARVARSPDGTLVVVWSSYPSGGGRRGVFGQRWATPPDLIFADGLETGDLSAWSSAQTDSGDLSVSAGSAMDGTSFGLEALVDDQAGLYVQDDSPAGENRYRARFLLDPATFDPGEASGHFRVRVFLAFEDAPFRRLVQVVLKRQGGQYSLGARVRRDDDSLADTGFSSITPAPHVVYVFWGRAGAPGANDGAFELWVDGGSVATLSGLDTDARAVDFVRLGAMSVKPGASGTLRFDEFASRRWTYIGPP